MQRKVPKITDGVTLWQCSHCHEYKPEIAFYRNGQKWNGIYGACKLCMKKVASSNERKEIKRVWRDKNRESLRVQRKKYYDADPERYIRHARSNQLKYPEKLSARQALRHAIEAGKAIRPDKCASCGKVCTVHGHHTDYERPLKVVWLCPVCHSRVHKSSVRTTTQGLYHD
jgi:hypothetical protein